MRSTLPEPIIRVGFIIATDFITRLDLRGTEDGHYYTLKLSTRRTLHDAIMTVGSESTVDFISRLDLRPTKDGH